MLYRSILKTWRAAGYDNIYVFPKYSSYLVRGRRLNLILVASVSGEQLSKGEIEDRAIELFAQGPVQVKNFIKHARHVLLDEADAPLEKVPVLTDDYAPVELMVTE
jgi:hypothetical protein